MCSKNKTLNENTLNLLKKKFPNVTIAENFDSFEISIEDVLLENFLINIQENAEPFKFFFKTKDDQDKISFSISNNVETKLTFNTIKDIKDYKYKQESYDTEKGKITMKIIKKEKSDYLTIYSLNSFVNFIQKKEIEDILQLFDTNIPTFKILDGNSYNFYTKYFIFLDNSNFSNQVKELKAKHDNSYREQQRNKIDENSHFANRRKIKFIPEDFYILNKSDNAIINTLFDKITLALVLSAFSNISEFSHDLLCYKMNGYKTISKKYKFNDFDTKFFEKYYKAYQEVFNAKTINIADKLELARNIITLHVIGNDFTNIHGNILDSIKSSYNIYLKENIKKYIDIKHKITDSIFSLSNKFDEVAYKLTSSFKTSFYTLITFFISLILLKIINKTDSNFHIFTEEILIFLSSILFGMFLFKHYNIHEVKQTTNRLQKTYKQLKEQYTDILDKNDLEQIFSKYNFEKNNLDFIEEQIKKYNLLWDISLLVYLFIFIIGTFLSTKTFGLKYLIIFLGSKII